MSRVCADAVTSSKSVTCQHVYVHNIHDTEDCVTRREVYFYTNVLGPYML